MSANKESYDQLLVIFGASGDLTSRKLLLACFDITVFALCNADCICDLLLR